MAGSLLAALTTSETKLTASDAAAGDRFARVANSLTTGGRTVVIGAYTDDDAGTSSGSAYIFEDDGTGWAEQAKLTASDAAQKDLFGQAVAISGDTVAIGSFFDDDLGSHSGSVYVHERNGGTWPETAKLLASDGAEADQLGTSVAISGNAIVTGAPAHDDGAVDAGAAYVFRFDGTSWAQEAELTASEGAAGDRFGRGVGMDGDVVVVGAPFVDAGDTDTGAAYVFRWNGTSWTQEAKLVASDATQDDLMGLSVSVSGDTVVVGAFKADPGKRGAAYVFRFDGTSWSEEAKLVPGDAKPHDWVGLSVAIDGDNIVVGGRYGVGAVKDTGSAWVFQRTGTVWREELKLFASDGAYGDFFGSSVSIFQSTVLVGAPFDDDAGLNSGSVYVYELTHAEVAVHAIVTPSQDLENVTLVLQGIVDNNPTTQLADKVEDAIAKVETALDELAKTPPDNQAAVGNIEGAVGDLEAAVNEGLDPTQGMQLVDQLAGNARQLAVEVLNQAITRGGDRGHINQAQEELAEGDALRASGEFKDAVDKYKDAVGEADGA